MNRLSLVLALAVGTAIVTVLLAGIGYTYASIRQYGTALFAIGGVVICSYYTWTYFRNWRILRKKTNVQEKGP